MGTHACFYFWPTCAPRPCLPVLEYTCAYVYVCACASEGKTFGSRPFPHTGNVSSRPDAPRRNVGEGNGPTDFATSDNGGNYSRHFQSEEKESPWQKWNAVSQGLCVWRKISVEILITTFRLLWQSWRCRNVRSLDVLPIMSHFLIIITYVFI